MWLEAADQLSLATILLLDLADNPSAVIWFDYLGSSYLGLIIVKPNLYYQVKPQI